MADVPRVLLDQVEQDPPRLGARPSGQVRRAGCSRPPSASASVTVRFRATLLGQVGHGR